MHFAKWARQCEQSAHASLFPPTPSASSSHLDPRIVILQPSFSKLLPVQTNPKPGEVLDHYGLTICRMHTCGCRRTGTDSGLGSGSEVDRCQAFHFPSKPFSRDMFRRLAHTTRTPHSQTPWISDSRQSWESILDTTLHLDEISALITARIQPFLLL